MQDSDRSKLFVGGVSRQTTDETLREHFSKYGTVVSAVIAKDGITGNPRGFAFVSFTEPSAVDNALRDAHEILGRMVCPHNLILIKFVSFFCFLVFELLFLVGCFGFAFSFSFLQ